MPYKLNNQINWSNNFTQLHIKNNYNTKEYYKDVDYKIFIYHLETKSKFQLKVERLKNYIYTETRNNPKQ